MSRGCSAVNPGPVTIGSRLLTSVLSMVGAYTSDSVPSAIVYQTFEPVLVAVPAQSLRPSSKNDAAPGAPAASAPGDPTVRLNTCIDGTFLPTAALTVGSVTETTGCPGVSGIAA